MSIKNMYVQNNGVTIHYLDGNESVENSLTPLVHIPGAFGSAESFLNDCTLLSPRRVISVSQRGRGKSDVPEHGYNYATLVEDLEKVLQQSKLQEFFLYCFSLGTPSALGLALKYPERVKGIIIGDYPAQYPSLPAVWTEKFLAFPDLVNPIAVKGTQKDSEHIELWDQLHVLQCPILLMTGGNKAAEPRVILTQAEIELYKEKACNSKVEVFVFQESGHRLWEPDHQLYINAIQQFLAENDKKFGKPILTV
ncbi:hypothetical protein CVD28_05720 [Bacillus sp. M6-12]|uniref:alpha/beta fold hydrolase n=1 Tax=Bacillus sp. M6-12 TaxID=2054166 RepID=UPI000C785D87|nr:alpha/beta hydrolase [Bacillus sp. M6-12]PLS18634.1 hypothetical protein CVD28_05720 [Bacillus sp. M6-12]